MTALPFIHLRVHSSYSLLQGALKVESVVKLSKKHHQPAVALVDHDNLFGSLEFSQYACKEGIQPIMGMTLSLKPEEAGSTQRRVEPDQLLLYAKDETGFQNLLALASLAYLESADPHAPCLTYEQLSAQCGGLIALAGKFSAVGKQLLQGKAGEAEKSLLRLKECFGDRLYIELMRHDMPEEKAIEPGLIDLAFRHHVPLVATNNVYFASEDQYEAHDALLCISHGRYISEADRPRLNPQHYYKSPEEMRVLFADLPEALENTARIAQRCAVYAPSRSPILPGFHMTDEAGNVLTESDALRKRARDGLQARLEAGVFTDGMSEAEREETAKPYYERLEFELDVIITMKFPGYFLIVSDFITWSKEHDIPVGPGRGSGAGSVVAWALLITDLDPLKFGLIFERFLNPERVSMPDFDIDFCQDRRDEVIRYVQGKYGADKVAQIITFGKLQARAVLRDVGRVLQMPYPQVDGICKLVPNNPANPVTLQQAIDMEPLLKKAIETDETVAYLVKLALQLEGLYRHASTHAAGVVIADRPLQELVPLYSDPKSDIRVVQYSMKYAEGAGLVKFDFLGLKTLSVLQKTVNFLAKRGITIDLSHLPFDDKKTYQLLTRGETVGVFQFESAGMQDALRKLRPDRLEDLIALGALYRPGPMDNIPTYIARKHGRETPDYLHPKLEEVLKETYGVIIYQEQVQKIAQVLAGYTLGAADLLRRAMGKKIKEEMDAQRETFTTGAKENHVDPKQASFIFDLVAKFAGYGFNKSHAAAYAVIAYQTAYLKANYPVEFLAASMDYEIHSTDKLSLFRQEASRYNIEVLPPDVNKSEAGFSVEQQEDGTLAIRYALAAVKNVGAAAMDQLSAERKANGIFTDAHDFASRIDTKLMNRRQMENLVLAGAMDSVSPNRQQFFESLDLVASLAADLARERESNQTSLFGDASAPVSFKLALKEVDDWLPIERLQKEFDALGFYLSAHPLESFRHALKQESILNSAQLPGELGQNYRSVKLAGIITSVKMKVSPRGRFAFVSLSDTGGIYEVSVFDEELLAQSRDIMKEGTMVMIVADGKLEESGPRLIAQKISLLDESTLSHRGGVAMIELSSLESLPQLKSLLGAASANASQVMLQLVVNHHTVKMRLAERHALPPTILQRIQALKGVARAELR